MGACVTVNTANQYPTTLRARLVCHRAEYWLRHLWTAASCRWETLTTCNPTFAKMAENSRDTVNINKMKNGKIVHKKHIGARGNPTAAGSAIGSDVLENVLGRKRKTPPRYEIYETAHVPVNDPQNRKTSKSASFFNNERAPVLQSCRVHNIDKCSHHLSPLLTHQQLPSMIRTFRHLNYWLPQLPLCQIPSLIARRQLEWEQMIPMRQKHNWTMTTVQFARWMLLMALTRWIVECAAHGFTRHAYIWTMQILLPWMRTTTLSGIAQDADRSRPIISNGVNTQGKKLYETW